MVFVSGGLRGIVEVVMEKLLHSVKNIYADHVDINSNILAGLFHR
mgnify:CR=1 FL=1